MAWIHTVPEEEASGLLAKIYEEARRRAGRVFAIVRAMSLQPRVAQGSLDFYGCVMRGRGPLTRAQREMIAVVVSRSNACHY